MRPFAPLASIVPLSDVPREPFTRDQLAYIEREALRALRVWNRAIQHLDRIGASGHELARLVRTASDAEHALRVHAMYAKHEAEKRAKEGNGARRVDSAASERPEGLG